MCVRAFESGIFAVVVFRVDEDGEGLFTVESDSIFKVLPLVVVHLNGELLRSMEMSPGGGYADAVELADFLRESFAIFAPGDENRVRFRVDEAEFLCRCFETVGFETVGLGFEAGHVA